MDAVIFDMGGVLLDWSPVRLFQRQLQLSEEDARGLVEAIDLGTWNRRLDAGARFDELVPRWQAAYPQHADAIALYHRAWRDALAGPIDGMSELVDELRGAGIAVGVLTNCSAETFPTCCEVASVLQRVDGCVVSGSERQIKPDRGIYELALTRFGFEPARTVFVDDHADNVDAAAALGMAGVVFEGEARLRQHLRALGLPVRPPAAGRTSA